MVEVKSIKALGHRLRGHSVSKRGAIQPNYVTEGGIRVFEQSTFRAPMAHYYCNTCDKALY